MEKFVEKTYLYDFYGELLNPHQQRIYEEVVFEDYSISEVARDEGISRQGVHDLIKRCQAALEEYESRLHLVERFLKIRTQVKEILALTKASEEDFRPEETKKSLEKISALASAIVEEL